MTRTFDFDRQAQGILEHLRSDERYDMDRMPRPFIVEFTGSPSSGKTTTITELDKFFRHQGFRVWRPQEGAEVIRHIPRTTPIYNVRTGLYAIQIVLDESYGHKYDLVILDRGLFDVHCWMKYWLDKKAVELAEADSISQFFLNERWVNNIDAAYFMVCDPVVAVKREMRLALSEKLGETTNPETIRKLAERYRSAHEILSPKFPQLRLIDTTDMPEQLMVMSIATMTLAIFEKKIKAHNNR